MIKELIKSKIIIFDGAMGTRISALNLNKEDFQGYDGLNEYLNISKPKEIEKIHLQYFASGADVVETNTFGANSINLIQYGLQSKVKELNVAAVKIAKSAALKAKEKYGRDFYVAGSIGPTSVAAFIDQKHSFDSMYEVYFEQVEALAEAGADLLLFETAHDMLNLKAGLLSAFDVLGKLKKDIPVIASVTMDKNNLMLSGHNAAAAYYAIEHFPLFAFGFNCSTGPEDMQKRLKEISDISGFPVFVMPNAGLPDENGCYCQTPEKFAHIMKEYCQKGYFNIAGGCCGSGFEHIKALSEAVKNLKPQKKIAKKNWTVSHLTCFNFEDIEPPMLIGERNNSIGSKKFRDLIAEEKFEEAVDIAKNQVLAGAHALDICMGNPERDEASDLRKFLPLVSKAVKIPLMIDTTDMLAAETALKINPGKMIINSVNFEFKEEKPLKACRLNKKYGAKIVFGLIDDDKKSGLPIYAERKISIAKKAYDFMLKNGIKEEDLIFDALVFPLSVGGEYAQSALETIKAVKELKKLYPKVKTLLGVSNVSFGLPPKAREVLNSVFLHEALLAGLDMAIVNVEKTVRFSNISSLEKELCLDLIFNKNPKAVEAFADHFRSKKQEIKKEEVLSFREKIYRAITEGRKADIEEYVIKELENSSPMDIINGPVLKAMQTVGEAFSKGDLIVTEVLLSAEVTKKAVNVLEPKLKENKIPKRGKILLATVKGDVHDIGKNLVSVIFESNGFEVVDLGVKIPSEEIVKKALEEKPNFIGLSGLLVRSTQEMATTALELAQNNINCPLLLGGAALTEKFVKNNIEPVYKGKVFYAKDAMDGLNCALSYLSGAVLKENERKQVLEAGENQKKSVSSKTKAEYYPLKLPEKADMERKIFEDFDTDKVFDNLDWEMFNFKFLRSNLKTADKLKDFSKLLEETKKEIKKEKLIKPAGLYRIFRANSKNDSVYIYGENKEILEEFYFPRQNGKENLSIADFINPGQIGADYMAFLAATAGFGLKMKIADLRKNGDYSKAYLIESLALMMAESMAEILHYFIRKDWGLEKDKELKDLHKKNYSGKRYSFGYPACPDFSNQEKIFKLIKPQDIGITLTENFMMDPEASVSAFVLHNDKAMNFSVL